MLSALLGQLARHGVDRVDVLARGAWEASVRQAVGDRATVHAYHEPAGVFGGLTDIMDASAGGPVLLVPGEVLAHDGALSELLARPAATTAVLVRPLHSEQGQVVGEAGPPVRTQHGTVVSAGSAYHEVTSPDGRLVPALLVAEGDVPLLTDAVQGLSDVTASREDPDGGVVPLATVALARSGVAVAAVPLAGFVWRCPASPSQVAEAGRLLREVDEDKLRLDSVVKDKDGLFTTFLVSPYSKHLARWAARHDLTPNQVTLVSLVVGLASAGCFAAAGRGWLVLGAVLLQVSFTLDCVDGQLARYTRNFSALGAWLDATFDRTKEYVVYAGLAIGASRSGDDVWVLAAAALALQTFRHTVDFGFAEASPATTVEPVRLPLSQLDDVPASRAQTAPADRLVVGDGPAGDGAIRVVTDVERAEARSVAASAVGLVRAADRHGWAIWAKRVIILPIGERWALTSVLIAFTDARTTFAVLLVLGAVAAAYTTTGRALRMVAR